MKVKFGDLTVRQVKKVCKSHTLCNSCPFAVMRGGVVQCSMRGVPKNYDTDEEIDLPDEEVKDDA